MGGILYESLVVAALWLLSSAVVTTLFGTIAEGIPRLLLQGLSICVISAYFLWCWTHGGQTLAMKTWRIRVVDRHGRPLSMGIASLRFLLACAGLLLGGLGLWWALLDRDGLFLHDRLAHTRLILLGKS